MKFSSKPVGSKAKGSFSPKTAFSTVLCTSFYIYNSYLYIYKVYLYTSFLHSFIYTWSCPPCFIPPMTKAANRLIRFLLKVVHIYWRNNDNASWSEASRTLSASFFSATLSLMMGSPFSLNKQCLTVGTHLPQMTGHISSSHFWTWTAEMLEMHSSSLASFCLHMWLWIFRGSPWQSDLMMQFNLKADSKSGRENLSVLDYLLRPHCPLG